MHKIYLPTKRGSGGGTIDTRKGWASGLALQRLPSNGRWRTQLVPHGHGNRLPRPMLNGGMASISAVGGVRFVVGSLVVGVMLHPTPPAEPAEATSVHVRIVARRSLPQQHRGRMDRPAFNRPHSGRVAPCAASERGAGALPPPPSNVPSEPFRGILTLQAGGLSHPVTKKTCEVLLEPPPAFERAITIDYLHLTS